MKYLPTHTQRPLLVDVIMISFLTILLIALMFLLLLLLFHSYLAVTNQTTYELLKRQRIPYMRMVPERVYPFSKGACRNLYNFCFARTLEPLPSANELEQMSKPYTCIDLVSCRCCC
ncbi:protein S-acyltransferase 10-like [Bidens hawaiensis]|uniref:protein S-acyltransferase 10-like n=1 Tax=Bidens hawaiensis TaxID=980011 RepID=UPI004049745E